MPLTLEPLKQSDVPAAASLLAKAFADDPVMCHIWRADAQLRERRLNRYFTSTLTHHHLQGGGVDGAWDRGTDELVGVAVWNPPGHWRTGLRSTLRQVPSMIRALGPRLAAALTVRREFDAVHPEQPHWYLCHIGTAPNHRKRGVATDLLEYRLTRLDQAKQSSYLVATRRRTTALYQHAGFAMTAPLTLGAGPTLWPMWRPPRVVE